jgi:hypothetical protein
VKSGLAFAFATSCRPLKSRTADDQAGAEEQHDASRIQVDRVGLSAAVDEAGAERCTGAGSTRSGEGTSPTGPRSFAAEHISSRRAL